MILGGGERFFGLLVLDKQDARTTGHEPAATTNGDAMRFAESADGSADPAIGGDFFELKTRFGRFIRPDEYVAVAPALGHEGNFGADDLIDPADLVANFPGNFE